MNFESPQSQEKREREGSDPRAPFDDARKEATLHKEKPKTNPIGYKEVFSPKDALETLKKAPREERAKHLKAFKEKLAQQKDGLAELQSQITNILSGNPGLTVDELLNIVEKKSHFIGLDEDQKEIIQRIIEEYVRKHLAVEKIREEFPDDAELFEHIFRHKPKGDVEVLKGPMTLYFRCFDVTDYAVVYHHSITMYRDFIPTKKEIEEAEKSSGLSLNYCRIIPLSGCITAENAWLTNQNYGNEIRESRTTYLHEEQHAIHQLFEETSQEEILRRSIMEENDPERFDLYFRSFLKRRVEFKANSRAADELLAYFREENLDRGVEQLLLGGEEGGLYDYLKADRKWLQKQLEIVRRKNLENEWKIALALKALEEVYGDSYKEEIVKGAEAIKLLRNSGYSIGEVIALLTREPLSRWKKVAERQLGVR